MLSVKQGIFSLKMSTSSKSLDAACLQRFFFHETSKYGRVSNSNCDCVISVCTGKAEFKQTERADENSLQVILIVVIVIGFGSRDYCDKITVLLPFKDRIFVNPFALSMNNLLNVGFSSQEPSKLPREIFVRNKQFETTKS